MEGFIMKHNLTTNKKNQRSTFSGQNKQSNIELTLTTSGSAVSQ